MSRTLVDRFGGETRLRWATVLLVTAITTLALVNWVRITRSEPSPYTVRWLTRGATPLAVALFCGNAVPIALETGDRQLIRDAGPLAIVQVIVLTQWGIAVGETLYGAAGPAAAASVLAGLLAVYYALEARTFGSRSILDPTHLVAGVTLAAGLSSYWILAVGSASVPLGIGALGLGVGIATVVRL